MKDFEAYIFDLDDTLYCEHDYVRSGFWMVANELANQRSDMGIHNIYRMLIEEWQRNGRGRVFDDVCKHLGIDADIARLVHLYRSHRPDISLYDDAKEVLAHLRQTGKKIGIITDGDSTMQWAKIKALELEHSVDKIIVTGDLGREHWKPSETPYRKMVECLGLNFCDCVYIGDNPNKDFIAAKRLGMGTVRIVREVGDHMRTKLGTEYEADMTIRSLTELIDKRW
ncbi:HAD family hydrolase [Geobacillus sp. Y412MC52]|uniref:HAD family hydrolase n=1 Tax=Geobacillus sp. (strain Y412MC52) TaxID=550542 RepID=UPI00018C1C78|nr:HAD-IA family hydrolase [Geobacillus sp. Y412MC52]ADU95594.1 Haloacid dehalogenase domain protein hydrolase [Geobacillus sp. Y412MC52]ALA70058.1 hydrolase [Geobacillus stearothermophilus 10]